MKKRVITCIVALMMTLDIMVGLAGCRGEDYLPEYENEYFRYAVRTNKDGTKEGYLVGFTELGAQQTALILPQEIDGVPIVDIGYERQLGWGAETVGDLQSNNLLKLYAPFAPIEGQWQGYFFYNNIENAYLVQWKELFPPFVRTCGKGNVLGYKALEKFFEGKVYGDHCRIANTIYCYNFVGAEDDGYYWVDSYDNSVVEFIPPEPRREGYTFDGWYKEPECVNAWDFKVDITCDEIVITTDSEMENYCDYMRTYLYAKWIKEG